MKVAERQLPSIIASLTTVYRALTISSFLGDLFQGQNVGAGGSRLPLTIDDAIIK